RGVVNDLPDAVASAAPHVLGLDDFALRRGHVYATILVDAATGRAIEVLPGREAGPLENWLTAHPGARVICRDRAGAYAERARGGAPGAIQVADRWRLWHNLAEHTAKALAHHAPRRVRPSRRVPRQLPAAARRRPPPEPVRSGAAVRPGESRLEARWRGQHAADRARAARGLGLRAIARELGADRKAARRFAQ